MNIFPVGTYHMLKDVSCIRKVTIPAKTLDVEILKDSCKVVMMPGKSTLKTFIKYLIVFWLNENVIPGDERRFNGIELAEFIKMKTARPKMYNPTVFAYMNQLARAGKVGVFCAVRKRSLYFCQWIDREYLRSIYSE